MFEKIKKRREEKLKNLTPSQEKRRARFRKAARWLWRFGKRIRFRPFGGKVVKFGESVEELVDKKD